MTELPVTWKRAGLIYWALFWRSLAYLLLPIFCIAFALGMLMALNKIPVERYQVLMQVVAFLISIIVSVRIIRDVFRLKFGNFRIALVLVEAPAELVEPVQSET